MRMRSGRSWSLLITYLAQLSLMGSRSKTTTSTWKCLLLIWSPALGSTLTGEQWTKKNGSGWAWGLLMVSKSPNDDYKHFLLQWIVSKVAFWPWGRGGHNWWQHWSVLMESPYIQDNILGHSEELFLSKCCHKTALNARSPRFFISWVKMIGFE